VDTYAYLTDVIQKLAAGWPARLDELLPAAWAAARRQEAEFALQAAS